ncbi:hypothetical protein CKK34_5582 [Yarrowia sp. E02]|nr:hypothetical protein CKK34_5582 [Yarrowia sp. E02]
MLPIEVIQTICEHLDIRSLLALSQTSQHLRTAVSDSIFETRLNEVYPELKGLSKHRPSWKESAVSYHSKFTHALDHRAEVHGLPPPSIVEELTYPVNDFTVKYRLPEDSAPRHGFKSLREVPHPIKYHERVFDKYFFPVSDEEEMALTFPVIASAKNINSGAWQLQTMRLVKNLGYHSFPRSAEEFEPPLPKSFRGASKWHQHVNEILRQYIMATCTADSLISHRFLPFTPEEVHECILKLMSARHLHDPVVSAGMRYAEVTIWINHNSVDYADTNYLFSMMYLLQTLSKDLNEAIRDHTDFTLAESATFMNNIVHARLRPKCLGSSRRTLLPEHILDLSPVAIARYDPQPALESILSHYENRNKTSIWDSSSDMY